MTYLSANDRYERLSYRRTGRSGLDLPAISLGLWQNFGGVDVWETGRAVVRRAFDRGVTHFDLANNYGPPPGSAEESFGRYLKVDLAPHRDELVIATKAGHAMWPGRYGDGGSKKYLIASLDQSLRRMGLDYVDIFYHHRPDPSVPVAESMEALAQIHRQGKALYVGISKYSPEGTREAVGILRDLGVPCLIHQVNYSMLNRAIEGGLLDTLGDLGLGCIAFSPLAQGLLTDKYLAGIPAGSRITRGGSLPQERLTEKLRLTLQALSGIATKRGQSIAQLALSWVLRDPRVTSALVGARTVEQLDNSLDALDAAPLDQAEITAIESALA